MSGDSNKIIVPKPLMDRIRLWAVEMKEVGEVELFVGALRLMDQQLKFNAKKWGDPLFNYPKIEAVECRGLIERWLLVWYGWHAASRTVYVRDIRPAPGSPLSL